MCPHSKMKPRPQMAWGLMQNVIDEMVPGASVCCPFLMQEPALETRLPAILAYIKQVNQRCATSVYTNMGAWTPEVTRSVLKSGCLDDLHISFYGPTKELYEKWQPGMDWGATKSNIRALFEERNRRGGAHPGITMHYMAIPELVGEDGGLLRDFIMEWGKYADVFLANYDTFHGDVPNYGDEERFFGPQKASVRTPCSRLWSTFSVLSDGKVVACCLDYAEEEVMGDMTKESGLKIWRGEKFEAFRQKHVEAWKSGGWSGTGICEGCGVWKRNQSTEWNNLWTK